MNKHLQFHLLCEILIFNALYSMELSNCEFSIEIIFGKFNKKTDIFEIFFYKKRGWTPLLTQNFFKKNSIPIKIRRKKFSHLPQIPLSNPHRISFQIISLASHKSSKWYRTKSIVCHKFASFVKRFTHSRLL